MPPTAGSTLPSQGLGHGTAPAACSAAAAGRRAPPWLRTHKGGRGTMARSAHGQVTVRSRSGEGQVTVRSRSAHGQVTVGSRASIYGREHAWAVGAAELRGAWHARACERQPTGRPSPRARPPAHSARSGQRAQNSALRTARSHLASPEAVPGPRGNRAAAPSCPAASRLP